MEGILSDLNNYKPQNRNKKNNKKETLHNAENFWKKNDYQCI